MQRLTLLNFGPKDRGATMVTFALAFCVIMGFVGIGIDGAVVFAKRQQVQNGADSAAFAVAQAFALEDCLAMESPAARGIALEQARANVANDTDTTEIEDIQCDPDENELRVRASADQPPFFMSFVGVGAMNVPAAATVEWGSPVAGAAFPLTIARCEFEHVLNSAGGEYDGTAIQVWIPNTNEGAGGGSEGPSHCAESEEATGGYPPGGFGWLETSGECSADYVDLDAAAPIVDGSPGNDAPGSCDWGSLIGSTVIIPIFDEAVEGSSKDYYVSEFASIEIVTLRIQSGSGNGTYGDTSHCTNASKPTEGKWTNHCFYGIFRGYVSIDDHWELGDVNPDGPLIVRLKS